MYNVAIAGATGAVGQEFLYLLEERAFPIKSLKLLASKRSSGKTIRFKNQDLVVEEMTHDAFNNVDIAFFSAGAARSLEFAPSAAKAGAVVIDNSSAFRMDENVPLIVPECNPERVKQHANIIANPNCSTIQLVASLKPIHDKFGIKSVRVATYQAVSGSGAKAIEELESQVKTHINGGEMEVLQYPKQILFNAIPHVDVFMDNGYTKEEMKMTNETKKILGAPEMLVSATCVRIPVFRSHSEAVWIETEKEITVKEAIEVWKNSPGIEVTENDSDLKYPTPLEATKTYPVYIGRVRQDLVTKNGLTYWCVADQLYKGAALNAIQIAEIL